MTSNAARGRAVVCNEAPPTAWATTATTDLSATTNRKGVAT